MSLAQVDSTALSQEYYDMGMEIYDFQHRRQAKDLFVMATEMDPSNAKAHLMAGKSIMLTVHKQEALKHFIDAWVLEPDIDEDILYWIGQAYHHSEQFDSAILFYEQFNRQLARSMRFQRSLKINEVNRKIFECRNGKIFTSYPVDVEITNLSENINSEYPEYAPTITADESLMVFTSRRPEDNINPVVAEDLDFYEDIYISRHVNGEWTYAKNIGAPLNTMYHNASINLAPDGSETRKFSCIDW
jgi:tetratricopeptide (TPR) repeat protein